MVFYLELVKNPEEELEVYLELRKNMDQGNWEVPRCEIEIILGTDMDPVVEVGLYLELGQRKNIELWSIQMSEVEFTKELQMN